MRVTVVYLCVWFFFLRFLLCTYFFVECIKIFVYFFSAMDFSVFFFVISFFFLILLMDELRRGVLSVCKFM